MASVRDRTRPTRAALVRTDGCALAGLRTRPDVVFVYTLGSLLRVSVSNAASKIMFNDLPSVDAILDMCHVRWHGCRAPQPAPRLTYRCGDAG